MSFFASKMYRLLKQNFTSNKIFNKKITTTHGLNAKPKNDLYHRIHKANEMYDFTVPFVTIIESSRYSEIDLASFKDELYHGIHKVNETSGFTVLLDSIIESSPCIEMNLASNNRSNLI